MMSAKQGEISGFCKVWENGVNLQNLKPSVEWVKKAVFQTCGKLACFAELG